MSNLKTLPAVLLLGLVPLAACGNDDDTADKATDDTCATFESGSTSEAVEVSGEFGKADPTATFSTPQEIEPDDLQRTVVDEGDGDVTEPGDQVEAVISIFNGRTGDRALSQPATLTVGDENTFEAFRAGIECVPTGSRLVTTVAAADVYGDAGLADLDIKGTDALVIVTDVVKVRVDPEPKPWTEDVPKVSLDKPKPQVELPDVDPPTDVLVKVLQEGDGDTVEAGDVVTVKYQLRTWEQPRKVVQQNFGAKGQPAQFPTDGVVPGFKVGVIGQKVGTTVLINVPAEYGYGTEEVEGDPLAGKNLVFVVEIVSVDS